MNHTLYVAANAAVKHAIEAHTARLESAVAETGRALLAAARKACSTALPPNSDGSPHVLQPLADLMADSVTLTGLDGGCLAFGPEALSLHSRADANTAHNVDGLEPSRVRGAVRGELDAYGNALVVLGRQRERLKAATA